MALINCPDCDKEVSTVAYDCPSCGGKLREPERTLFGKLCSLVLGLLSLGLLIELFGGVGVLSHYVFDIPPGTDEDLVIGMWVVVVLIAGLFSFFTRPKKR